MRRNAMKSKPETQTISWVDGLSDADRNTSDIGASIKMIHQGSVDAWREDARLHRRFMDLEEENNEQLREIQTRLRRSEKENHNLQLLLQQLQNKKRLLEMQLRLRDEQLSSYFSKQQPASIKCKKPTKDFHPQKMTINSLLPPSSLPSSSSAPLLSSSSSSSSDHHHISLLKTANETIDRLEKETKELKKDKEDNQNIINKLNKKLKRMDIELEKLCVEKMTKDDMTKSELDSRPDIKILKEVSKEKCRCDEWKTKLEDAQSAITELKATVNYEREKHKKSSQQLMNALHKSERCNDRNNIFIQRLQNTIKQINNNNNNNNNFMNNINNNNNNKNNNINYNNDDNDDDDDVMNGYLKQIKNVLEESSHYQRLANQMKDMLEEKMKEIQNAEEDRKQVSILRSKLRSAEEEKDGLYRLMEGQKGAEEEMKGAIGKQEALINDMKKSLDESEKVISQQRLKLTSRKAEVTSLRDQLNVKSIVEGTKAELESEKQRLLGDVEKMTSQIQQLQQSLSSQQSSCSQLTASNNDLLYEVQRCQRVITSKDQQLSCTEERLKNAQQEIDRLQAISCHMHTEMGCKQEEVSSKEEELRVLKIRCEEVEDELKKLKDSEIELKERVGLLLRRIGWMDGEMVKTNESKRVVEEKMNEWMSVGEVVRKENAQLQEEIVCKTVMIHKLKNELEEQKNNLELGHQSEIRSLRSEVAKMATKNNVLQKEVNMLNKTIEEQRTQQHTQAHKMTQLEGQIAKAHRRIISEQFEKERMIQELKRNNLPLPNQTSLGAISPNSLARTIYQREEPKIPEVIT